MTIAITVFIINGIIALLMIHYGMRQIFDLAVKRYWAFLGYAVLFVVNSQLFFEFGNPAIILSVNAIGFLALSYLYSGIKSAKIIFILILCVMMIVAEGFSYLVLNYIYFLQHGVPMSLEETLIIIRTFTNIVYVPLLFVIIMTFRRIFERKLLKKNANIPIIHTAVFFVVLVGLVIINMVTVSIVFHAAPERGALVIIAQLINLFIMFLLIWLYNSILGHFDIFERAQVKE